MALPANRLRLATGRRTRRVLALFGVALALSLPGCGGGGLGGGGGSGGEPAIAIQTSALPSTGVGVAYSVTLTANGGTAPYAWSLTSGSALPPGLALSPTGTISGTATALGSFAFGVAVTDSSAPPATDTATYSILVSSFDASIALLHFGDAWTGESYPVAAIGAQSTTFTIVQNQSGGAITNANPSAGTASYAPGPSTGTDVIRATGSTGGTKDLTVPVVPNPARNLKARFSTTDVWHLRFEGKFDTTHAFVTDFHAALAAIGFRAPDSTGATGTTADELADLYARQQILGALSVMYGNGADGTPVSGGYAISFPFDEPGFPHVSPADGAVSNPAVNQFNVISMIAGGTNGVIGTAYLDGTDNGSQENDTTTATAGTLGVFVDEIGPYFNSAFHNATLPGAPVGASDVAALKALLYGLASPGGRYAELKRIGEGYGKTVAAVAAHEIGHSLGLDHTNPTVAGSIMNAAATFGPSATYLFVPSDQAILAAGLPGPGRGGSPLRVDALRYAGPGEGHEGTTVVTCACRVHRR